MEFGLLNTLQSGIFVILDLYILAKASKERKSNRRQRYFAWLVLFVTIEQTASMFVRMFKTKLVAGGAALQYAVYIVMFISMAVTAWGSMRYLLYLCGLEKKRPLPARAVIFLPCAVMCAAALASPATGWLFYLDGALAYHRGSMFFLQLVCTYVYALAAMVLIVRMLIRGENRKGGHPLRYFLCFVVPALAGMILQVAMNVDGGYSSIGLSVFVILLFIEFYVDEVREIERQKNEDFREELVQNNERLLALEDNFEAVYDVDLATGGYEVFLKGRTFSDKVSTQFVDNREFFEDSYQNIDKVAYPEDREDFKKAISPEHIQRVLETESRFDYYYRLLVDGEPVWFRMRVVYKDEKREHLIIGIFNASKDVEARQIAEQKALIDYFVDSYSSAYSVDLKDESFRILHMDTEFSEYFGENGNKREGMLRFVEEHIHPDDRALMRRMIDPEYVSERLRSERSFSFTVRELACGRERTMRGVIVRMTDEYHIAVGFMDITDQMEEQQRRLLGAIPISNDVLAKANIGLWAFELDEGQPPRMYGDETMIGLVGLDRQVPPEEMYHAWYDHIDKGSYDLVNDAVAKMVSGEHAEVQYPWHHPDGHTMIVRCGGIRNPEYTKGIRIEGTHQNVTQTLHFDEEQRKREEQQRRDELARVKAEASDKAKTEFLFSMSHDIRTPMNAILGYTDIALNHIDEPGRVSDSLKKIRLSGGHLLNLINDILEMSRIEAGKLEIVNAPLNIYAVTDGVKVMSEALAATKDITFVTKVGGLKNPYIYADELHINQVIINLISNAVKYTNPGGTVEYGIDQLTGPENGIARFRVTVKDNGIGMSEEFQKHLFESFAREQTSTVSKQEGAGLGLAIVKRIVDIIGGTIRVQSKKGEGSAFMMELPVKVMDEAAIAAYEAEHGSAAETGAQPDLTGRKLLLVEDNEMNREIASEMLKEAGLDVETAEDGAVAVRTLAEKGGDAYDFILMDIQMPVMNGYEATKEIRKLPGGDKIPIVALSANAFEEDKKKSLAAGMDAHVAKPINLRELLGVLEKLL